MRHPQASILHSHLNRAIGHGVTPHRNFVPGLAVRKHRPAPFNGAHTTGPKDPHVSSRRDQILLPLTSDRAINLSHPPLRYPPCINWHPQRQGRKILTRGGTHFPTSSHLQESPHPSHVSLDGAPKPTLTLCRDLRPIPTPSSREPGSDVEVHEGTSAAHLVRLAKAE